jgi:hypothetical protein
MRGTKGGDAACWTVSGDMAAEKEPVPVDTEIGEHYEVYA